MWMMWMAAALAGVRVPVQGAMFDADGAPLNGTRTVDVALSGNADGSAPAWSDQLDVTFVDGAFSLFLGEGDDLAAAVFRDNPALYLVVGLQGQTPAAPLRLGAAPRAAYADLAATAATADLATNATNAAHAESAATADLAALATNATNAVNATNALNANNAATATNATNAANAANAALFGNRPVSDFVLDGDDILWSDVDKTGAPAVVTAGLSAGAGVAVSGGQVSWAYAPGTGLRLNGTLLEAKFADFDLRYVQLGSGGSVAVSGSLKVGGDTSDCTAANRGAIRFDGTSFQGCTASGWSSLAGGSGGSSSPGSGNGTVSTPATTCAQVFASGTTTNGAAWIDPDGAGPIGAYQQYCVHDRHGGGWGLIFNLDTNDSARRDYQDTAFWQSSGTYGTAAAALTDDHKNAAFLYEQGTELMICAHNEGSFYGCAVYDFVGNYGSQTFNALMNLPLNTTVTGTRKASSGAVGTFGRTRNGGDGFIDHANPVIINSRYAPADGDNYTRIGTNFGAQCNLFVCNGHNYGGIGGQHFRSGWGALYEAASIHQYCPTQGGYGTNGAILPGSSSNAFDGGGGCSEAPTSLAPVDMAIFRRTLPPSVASGGGSFLGGSSANAGASCAAVQAAGSTASGAYWIDPDGTGPIVPYPQHCNLSDHSGGWGLVFNLDTNDGGRRDWQDTGFWTSSGLYGAATSALTDDHKSAGYLYQTGGELMICAHNEGVRYGCAVYDMLGAHVNSPFVSLMALNNTTITAARKANSGAVGSMGRSRNAGDPFVDRTEAVIVNSTYSPNDAANLTRIGTNYAGACGTINCNGHNFGGIGGQHYRAGWGTLYEASALNGYCETQGGYGTNGTGYNGNNAFDGYGFSGACSNPSVLAPAVDLAIYRR